MKRLVLTMSNHDVTKAVLEIQDAPVPKPVCGEVLIKVTAAPVNPIDYDKCQTTPEDQCPMTMGSEGSGVVVASGIDGGFGAPAIGTKVGFCIQGGDQGSWSEYVTVNSLKACFPMPERLKIEDAASFFLNPFTAVGILDTVRNNTSNNTFVHAAAASTIGQMMVKMAMEKGDVNIICVVRREEQAELLRGIGAKHIVVTGKSDAWKGDLKRLIDEHKCTCAFDPIGGEWTGQILSLLPNKGTSFVYGGLSGPVTGIDVTDIIYNQKELKGWWLTSWLRGYTGLWKYLRLKWTLEKVTAGLVSGGWSSTQFCDTDMENMKDDLQKQMVAGAIGTKLRIRFDDPTT